ncbi:DUF305 domain-containing protein [Streptomyces sp. NPDC002490]|uniref:DUF305 domain-containing protein n=1 Tax=Streptomyces sp. NPDC002490 TaxID=3154416 RepID=UPI00332647FE
MTAFTRAQRRTPARRFALAAAVAAASLVLAACGSDDDMDGMDHGGKGSAPASASASTAPTAPTGENPAPGAFNDADVMFAQMMIPHHEQALQMSALAPGRVKDSEVKELTEAISEAQDPEIQKMRSWLGAWGKPESAEDAGGHAGHSGGSGEMSGMMTDEEMASLKDAEGTAFDKKFAELMIAHHEGAVEMAEDELKNGRNATAKALADDVVKAQTDEIDQLKKILDRL